MNAWDDLKASQAVKPAPAAPELPPWEAFKAEQPPTAGEELQQAASSFTQGLLATPLGVAQSAAIGLTHLAGMAGLDWTPLEGGANEFAQSVRDIARVAIPGAERARGDFLADKLPEYLGSGVSFLLPGAYLAKIGVPTTLATMGLGAATQSAAQYQDALQHGADPETAWHAYLLGGGVGTFEALGGLSSMLARVDKASGGALGNALVHGLVEGLEEGGQEAVSQFASNLIAAHILKYDKDRELMDQVLENAAGGALSGILLSAATSAALHSQHGLTPATDLAPAKKAEPGGKSIEQVGAEVRGETAPTSPAAPEGGKTVEQVGAEARAAAGPTGATEGPEKDQPETYTTTGEPAENSSVQPGDKLGPVQVLPIESLREFNPAKQTDPAKVAEMAEAMKAGKPLGVVLAHEEPGGGLVFDDGSNRAAAAKLAGFTHVPVRVVNPKAGAAPGVAPRLERMMERMGREASAEGLADELIDREERGDATTPADLVAPFFKPGGAYQSLNEKGRTALQKAVKRVAGAEPGDTAYTQPAPGGGRESVPYKDIEDIVRQALEGHTFASLKEDDRKLFGLLMQLGEASRQHEAGTNPFTEKSKNEIGAPAPAEAPRARMVNPSEAPKTSLPPDARLPPEPTEERPFHEQAAALLARHALTEGKEALPGVADLARALPAELPGPVSRALKAYRAAVGEDFAEQAAPGARTAAAETKFVEALEEAAHPVAGFVATKRKLAEVRAARAKIGADYAARLKAGEKGLKIDTALAKDKTYQKLKREEETLERRVAEVEAHETFGMPEWLREAMAREGKSTGRIFNDVDMARPGMKEMLANDPVVQWLEKTNPWLAARARAGDITVEEFQRASEAALAATLGASKERAHAKPKVRRGPPPGAIASRWAALPVPPSLVQGQATTIELAGEKSLPAHYAVLEADELIPSHDARKGFAQNPSGDFNERAYDDPVEGRPFRDTVERIAKNPKTAILTSDVPTPTDGPPITTSKAVVLGGNARSMGVQLAYSRGGSDADALRQGMQQAATRFGIDASGLKNPVIVRVIDPGSEGTPGELSRTLNEPLTTAKGATTEAVSRGARVTPEAAVDIARALGDGTLRDALSDPGKASTILRALVTSGAFSQADIVQLTDPTKGTPTAAGKQVIEDALLGAVIRDVRVLSETPASVRQAIVRSLPALVRIKAKYHPVVEAVTHAAQGMAVLRESGQPIADALAQQVLPGVDVAWKMDPMGLGIMRSLIGEPPTKTAARFNEAAQKIDDFAAGQGSLFGEENLAPAARLAREFGLTPLEEAGLVEENEDIEEEPGEGRVMLDPGDLPVELQAGHPTDPAVGGGANLGTPIGGRLLGTLKEPAARPKGGLVSRPEIIEALSKVVAAAGGKTPIRWGRLGTRNARGVFKVEPEVIRVQQADNLATAAHEVGHALEKHILGWEKGSPWKKGLIDKALQKELLGLGKELYGKTKPAGGYKREGFAEFIRLYTMEPVTAKAKAPLFFSWFEVHFLGGDRGPIKDALLEVRRLADAWKAQGSKGRAEASIVEPTSLKETVKGLRARLTGDAVITSMVEAGHQLGKLSRAAEQRLGRLLNPTEDPFYLYQALRSTHSARVRQMVESGMVNLAGEKVGPALHEIRGLVEGRYKDFTIYLWARRAVALHASRRDAGISIEDARQLVEELGSTQFELAASKVYEWSEGVLNYAAQASPTFARVAEAIRKKDPGSYLPLQREFSELDSIWGEQKKARGLGAGGSIAKRLKGSGRRVKNPLPVLLANAERTVLSAHRRLVLDQVMKLSQLEGLGHLVEEVPVDQVPVAQATIEEILQRVQQKAGIPPNEGGLELKGTGFHEDTDFSDLLGETITFFAPAQFPKGQDPVIPVWDGKRVRWYAMDHRLASTLAGMDVYRLPKVADLVFGVPARLFRLGTTGLSASFGLVTNPLRDPQTLYKNTATSAWAPRIFIEYVKQLAVAGLHHATGGRYSSPYLDLFLRLGAEMAQPLGMDMRHTERAARQLFQGKAVRILDPRNALDFLRDLFQFPETAARVTEIKLIAREIGWEPGQPMTLDQSLRLLLGAKQSTVDFTAAGNLARVMNQAVPYFNAPIQGLRGEVRAGRRAPARFLFRGLQITAATLALWWMNKDKEWYRQLSARARALYWAIPFDWNGREELALIPRAQEGPMVFGSLPEAMADAWYRQDPKAASEFFSTLFDQLTPNLLPVVIDEARDQYRNRDSFWDTPLVPTGELRRRPEEQVGEYTSRAAKFLAHMFGKVPGAPEMAKSPRRIDHAMRGAFGGVSRDVVDLLGLGAPRGRGLSEPADAPVIGRLFQRGGALGYRPLAFQRLYDAAEAASQRAASTTLEKESREERDLRLMLEDAAATVSALTYVRSQAQDVDQRRALVKEAVDIALDALKNLQEKNPTRGPMRQARRYAERLEERAKP